LRFGAARCARGARLHLDAGGAGDDEADEEAHGDGDERGNELRANLRGLRGARGKKAGSCGFNAERERRSGGSWSMREAAQSSVRAAGAAERAHRRSDGGNCGGSGDVDRAAPRHAATRRHSRRGARGEHGAGSAAQLRARRRGSAAARRRRKACGGGATCRCGALTAALHERNACSAQGGHGGGTGAEAREQSGAPRLRHNARAELAIADCASREARPSRYTAPDPQLAAAGRGWRAACGAPRCWRQRFWHMRALRSLARRMSRGCACFLVTRTRSAWLTLLCARSGGGVPVAERRAHQQLGSSGVRLSLLVQLPTRGKHAVHVPHRQAAGHPGLQHHPHAGGRHGACANKSALNPTANARCGVPASALRPVQRATRGDGRVACAASGADVAGRRELRRALLRSCPCRRPATRATRSRATSSTT
jgi:hypothetical protein